MRAHLTLKSSNSKTGPIPVSTTERDSCGDCPLKKNGCMADDYHLSMHWDKVSSGERGTDWDGHCDQIAALPDAQLWRANQAGDLPRKGKQIDRPKMRRLVAANTGKRGFTYTHHALSADNLAALYEAAIGGFVVNLSANDLSHADTLFDTGLPVAVLLPTTQRTNTKTPAGRPVVICPAITHDNVQCVDCGLCANGDRHIIIGFPAHGAGAAKVDTVARRVIIPIRKI
jgi:hypothetical protein